MPKVYQKEKIIVSACLLGEYCRYDGQTKIDRELIKWLEDKEVIPFCPENPLFGTPRPAIFIRKTANGYKLIRSSDEVDVTKAVLTQTEQFMSEHKGVKSAILKSKSPSCGYQTTPIYNEDGIEIAKGNGVAASLMKKNLYTIRDEKNYMHKGKEKK